MKQKNYFDNVVREYNKKISDIDKDNFFNLFKSVFISIFLILSIILTLIYLLN